MQEQINHALLHPYKARNINSLGWLEPFEQESWLLAQVNAAARVMGLEGELQRAELLKALLA